MELNCCVIPFGYHAEQGVYSVLYSVFENVQCLVKVFQLQRSNLINFILKAYAPLKILHLSGISDSWLVGWSIDQGQFQIN